MVIRILLYSIGIACLCYFLLHLQKPDGASIVLQTIAPPTHRLG